MITFYVNKNNIFLNGFSGKNYGLITFISKDKKNDKGLYEHEKVHYKQWKKSPILMPLLYKFSKKHRYKYEFEAYLKQMKFTYNPDLFAKFICNNYNIDKEEKYVKESLICSYKIKVGIYGN
ncbi:MAG: hypothetical protein ACOC2W_01795 [bacterium]